MMCEYPRASPVPGFGVGSGGDSPSAGVQRLISETRTVADGERGPAATPGDRACDDDDAVRSATPLSPSISPSADAAYRAAAGRGRAQLHETSAHRLGAARQRERGEKNGRHEDHRFVVRDRLDISPAFQPSLGRAATTAEAINRPSKVTSLQAALFAATSCSRAYRDCVVEQHHAGQHDLLDID